jgi:oligoendopeptidase F
MLGIEKLRGSDIYAPIGSANRKYPFPQVVEIVLAAIEKFSPIMAQYALRVFEENHIDSELRLNKDSGGFSSGVLPGMTPWILVNYTEKVGEVATLAHELGHAVHSLLSQNHPIMVFHPPTILAETASTFFELLLLEELLRQNPDKESRRFILGARIDDAYNAIMRQSFITSFELDAHQAIPNGASVEDLCQMYLAKIKDNVGDSVDVDEIFKYSWLAIPHIFNRPFYCYSYTFGLLLVFALFKLYKEQGEAFVPKYLKLLSYGGSASPETILQEMGIDIRSKDFWQKGFDAIKEMIDVFRALE